MNKKVLKPLAFTAILFSFIISVVSCQMYSQADHYKKNGVAKRLAYLTYEIKYFANGGTGSCPFYNYKIGEEVQIRNNPYSAPTGLRFVCWNTKPDGNGSIYNPGDTFAMGSDDLILYAIWIDKDAHSITYYNTKNAANDNPYSFLESQSVSLNSLSLDYYTFGGWYTNSSYTGNPVTGWEPGTYSTNVSLWAKWNPIQYKVTYNLDGGTLPAGQYNPEFFTIETNHTLVSPQKTDYSFNGWYDEQGNRITVLNSTLIGNDLVLTARYTITNIHATSVSIDSTTYEAELGQTIVITGHYTPVDANTLFTVNDVPFNNLSTSLRLIPTEWGYEFAKFKNAEFSDGNFRIEYEVTSISRQSYTLTLKCNNNVLASCELNGSLPSNIDSIPTVKEILNQSTENPTIGTGPSTNPLDYNYEWFDKNNTSYKYKVYLEAGKTYYFQPVSTNSGTLDDISPYSDFTIYLFDSSGNFINYFYSGTYTYACTSSGWYYLTMLWYRTISGYAGFHVYQN